MREWLAALNPSRDVPSAASPELRSWAAERIGSEATAWAAEVTDTVVSHLTAELRTSASPSDVGVYRGCEECLLTSLVGLSEGSLHVVTPEAALDDASVAARTGIPLDRLLRTVWACHTAVQQALLDVIGATVPPGSLLLEIRRQNDMLATFMDRYVSDISATYARERLESESRILVERRRVVDSLLDGDEPSSEGERILGISWREYHLAALGWASGGNRTFDSDNSAFRFAERVALRHRASAWLIIERGDHVEFHWSFIHDAPIDVDIIEQELPSRMRLALGLVQSGANGFRSTTVAARRTRDVCLQMPGAQMVTHYDDVSLLALVAADQEHARAFVQRELTGLLGEDPMSVSIRQSLRLFLVAGRSRQLAAEASHVAPTTIAYRVKRAEEKLDRSTLLRPQELLAALELVHAFPQLSVPTSPREQTAIAAPGAVRRSLGL